MNVEASVIKQLLQLQLLNKMDLITSGKDTAQSPSSESDFENLLQSVLGQGVGASGSQSAAAGSPLAALAALSAMSGGATTGLTSGNLRSYQPYNSAASGGLNAAYLRSYEGGQDVSAADKPARYDSLIESASSRFGVDSNLVKAVIHQESSFNPRAVSPAGAKGLMQLMDGTGEGFGVTDPFDPQQNVHAGTQFLSGLLRKYGGNEGVALAAYNAGPGRVDRLGIRTDGDLEAKVQQLPQETQQYVRRVLSLKDQYAASKLS